MDYNQVILSQNWMKYGEDLCHVSRTPGGVPYNRGHNFAQESTAVVPAQLCSLPSRQLCWYERRSGENRKLASSQARYSLKDGWHNRSKRETSSNRRVGRSGWV